MIETVRLRLRDYTVSDFSFLQSLTSDHRVMKYIGNGQTRDKHETEEFFDKIRARYKQDARLGLKLIELKETAEPIGHAGILSQLVNGKEYMEIGYWIAPQHWGKGYATEIAQSLRKFGEQELKLEEMISLIQVNNISSQRVAEKNGMDRKEEVYLNGKEVYIYSTQL